VTREDAAVGKVLRRERALGRDHERLEQPLPDRLAVEQVARLLDDRRRQTERGDETRGVVRRCDHDGVRFVPLAVRAVQRPAASRLPELDDVVVLNAHAEPPRGCGVGLHDRLRPVEVAVLGAVRRTEHRRHVHPGNDLGQLGRPEQDRGHAGLLLERDLAREPGQPRLTVREEDIAAFGQRPDVRSVQMLCGPAVELERLAGEDAVHARAPLLPHTARLHSRGACADAGALEDRDVRAAARQLERRREPGDPSPDDADRRTGGAQIRPPVFCT
jgi:hypothetical protein